MVDRTSVQFQSLQDELSNAINNLVDDTQVHVSNAMIDANPMANIAKKNASGFSHKGGSAASHGGRKVHTLKRIHTSIKQFIHTNKHKRTLKHRRI
jgi:hypothetical protein